MIRTVKATLLVTALARFAAIALRAGSRRPSQMIWVTPRIDENLIRRDLSPAQWPLIA
jgi:hypothetical protein